LRKGNKIGKKNVTVSVAISNILES